MHKTITTAAATAATVVTSLLSLNPLQVATPAVVAVSTYPGHAQALVYPSAQDGVSEPEPALPTPPEPATVEEAPEAVPVAAHEEKSSGYDREAMIALVDAYASKYGVNAGIMQHTVACETGGTYDPKVRSFAIYNFSDPKRGIVKGEREQSYGLAQIHLPDNPNVTYEQATDPDYALNFLGAALARGEFWRWSCLVK